MSEDATDPAVVCTLTSEETAERAERVGETLASHYERTERRTDGVTLVFDGTDEALSAVSAFVRAERRCCSFAEYEIAVAPPYEETRLRITGPEGTERMFRDGLATVLAAASE